MDVSNNFLVNTGREVNIHDAKLDYRECVEKVNDFIAKRSSEFYDSADANLTYAER